MFELKLLHRIIRIIATWSIYSFFSEVLVLGAENVPRDGPLLVVSTHHNMMVDPAVLSSWFPHKRIMHYWSKASLFANPIARFILLSSCNIPVERKSKDNQKLFAGTFAALAQGKAVALFPEGTSYTSPRIMQVKDGASWAALEYTKWKRVDANKRKSVEKDVVVLPVGLVYTNKSKYRSRVILNFGTPITMEQYEQDFLSGDEARARTAAKRMTAKVEKQMIRLTVNAPDWDVLYVSRMARSLLWETDTSIPLKDFVPVSQAIIDIFATPGIISPALKNRLLSYYSLLQQAKLSNSALASLPVPSSMDPMVPTPLPSRIRTLARLVRDTIASTVRLPFFLFPVMIHLPAYFMAQFGARLAEEEEESQAQNKIVFSLLLLALIYPTMFGIMWALLLFSPLGAVISGSVVYMFALYHVRNIDANYNRAKSVAAAWRVLVGVWLPKKYDLSLTALEPYKVPATPKENEWITKRTLSTSALPDQMSPVSPPSSPSSPNGTGKRSRRPPSRRLVRHVLRARIDAARTLAAFMNMLETTEKKVLLTAPPDDGVHVSLRSTPEGMHVDTASTGQSGEWRSSKAVVAYLRSKGAKIAPLEDPHGADWAALSSEGEETANDTAPETDKEPMVWMPAGRQ